MSDPARPALPAWLEALSELSATWRDPEFWKDEGCRMDSTDCADALDKALADLRAAWQVQAEPDALWHAAQTVVDTFTRDEAVGYLSRDRQYAIAILGRALSDLQAGDPPRKAGP